VFAQRDPDRGLGPLDQRSGDLRAAHGVAAVASARVEAGAIVRHLKLPENSGPTFRSAAGTGQRRIGRRHRAERRGNSAWPDRDGQCSD